MSSEKMRGGFPGIGDRIARRLNILGYWKNGRPDVPRFCDERRYRPQYVYAWLKGRQPDYANLKRLAKDLAAPMAWILLGEEGMAEIRSHEMKSAPQQVKRNRRTLLAEDG